MKVRLLSSLLLSLLLFSNFSDDDQFVINWVKEHCYPINVEKDTFEEDLGFLDGVQKDKRIISIGEESHGISDFAKMRFGIFKYLVLHHGYTIYAVEDDFIRLTELNKYLQSGEGNPAEIMKNLFSSQANVTTLAMIEWMREYNSEREDQSQNLKIYGYDCQRSGEALEKLKDAFAGKKEIITFLDTVKLISPRNYYAPVLTEKNIDVLRNFIDESTDESSDTSFVNQLYRVIEYSHLITTGKGNRDEFMAKNIQWILNREGQDSKVVVSAHNGHTCYLQLEKVDGTKINNMGWCLRQYYPNEIFTIMSDFNKGSFLATEIKSGVPGTRTFYLPEAPESSLSYMFSKVGLDAFFLNSEEIYKNPKLKDWFSTGRDMRYVSAVFSEEMGKGNESLKKEKLLERCDGLIFINEVSEYKLLRDIDK